MQFLKTLFWVVLAVIAVLFAKANWFSVQLRLWGGLIADAKLPILLLTFFLIGFVPTMIVYRAKMWALRRRLEPAERNASVVPAPASPVAPPPTPSATEPQAVGNGEEERVATDTKVWPTA
jgi:uncharacterized integral membrane protein